MATCSRCDNRFGQFANFCTVCGEPANLVDVQPQAYTAQPMLNNLQQARARGFAQVFGLHPAIAFLTIIVDHMLFGSEGLLAILALPTGGVSLTLAFAISCTVACILGIIAYLAQKAWYGDEPRSAFIKALILAFLTAIPTSIPFIVYVPAGLLGFFRKRDVSERKSIRLKRRARRLLGAAVLAALVITLFILTR